MLREQPKKQKELQRRRYLAKVLETELNHRPRPGKLATSKKGRSKENCSSSAYEQLNP